MPKLVSFRDLPDDYLNMKNPQSNYLQVVPGSFQPIENKPDIFFANLIDYLLTHDLEDFNRDIEKIKAELGAVFTKITPVTGPTVVKNFEIPFGVLQGKTDVNNSSSVTYCKAAVEERVLNGLGNDKDVNDLGGFGPKFLKDFVGYSKEIVEEIPSGISC